MLLAVLTAVLSAPPSPQRMRVPHTASEVMVDGVFSKGEWDSAARLSLRNAQLYVQQSSEFVYLAIEYARGSSGIVDLYLSPRPGEIYDLHASAKLGERRLQSAGFPDWIWWNNRDWIANVSRVDSFEKHTFLAAPIREFQIRRSRFPGDSWKIRLQLTVMDAANNVESVTVFPGNSTERDVSDWLRLDLN